ncbi:MAG: acyl-CoA thioesterase [Microthrixaceae bacterium]
MSRFLRDTAVEPVGEGTYAARIDRGWWIERGPNGGYLAAIVLRAIIAEVDDPARRPRSITLHFLRPPVEGACEVHVVTERAGRGLTTSSARLRQDGRDCIIAIAALGVDRVAPSIDDQQAPRVEGPDALAPAQANPRVEIPIRGRYEQRPALGSRPFEEGEEAVTGGWIRTADDDPVDEVLVAALTDAWPPAVFARLGGPTGVPTVDLTIHFRHAPPGVPGWSLVRFRTSVVADGYLEEDGEVWSADGLLLAQSRQLAVVLTPG